MVFSATQIAELEAPLNAAVVKKPTDKFGPKGDYIEAWHAINEANRIFGFDGWSYTIELTENSLIQVEIEKTDYKTKDKFKEMQWQAAFTCVCTLIVGEVKRQDVGFGSGFAKQIGDAIEGATKEAATDALKRCLRTFGNPFGLALYDKSRANVIDVPQIPESEQRLIDGLEDQHSEAAVIAYWKSHAEIIKASPNREYLSGCKDRRKLAVAAVSQFVS